MRNPTQHDSAFVCSPVPAKAGIGLRHPHIIEIAEHGSGLPWLEIHSENYLVDGGPRLAQLEAIRRDHALSCHSVALSLGSHEGLDPAHLSALAGLFDRFQPGLISDHVAWTSQQGVYLNDLLPLPYSEEALDILCRNIDQAQEIFGRQLLMENPSTYLRFASSLIPEPDFLVDMAARTGCGILLDVNNIYVTSRNQGLNAREYIDVIANDAANAVGEIHIAGHTERTVDGVHLLIDDHSSAPIEDVWALLAYALKRLGPKPVLLEWDGNIPALSVMQAEAGKAQAVLDQTISGVRPPSNVDEAARVR